MTAALAAIPLEHLSSPSAEASLLGAAILRPDILGWLEVEARDFADMRNREVWDALMAVWERDGSVDVITLEVELHRRTTLDPIGGIKRLSELALITPTADNAEHYASEIVRKRIARDVVTAAGNALGLVRSGMDGEELLDEAQGELSRIEFGGGGKTVSAFESAKAEARRYMADVEEGVRPGIPTGILQLDERIGGLPVGVPVIVAARPSVGKSALVLNMADTAAAEGYGVHLVTYEDSDAGFSQRLLAKHSGVDVGAIRGRRAGADSIPRVLAALDVIRHRDRLHYEHGHGMPVHKLVRRIRAERRRLGTRLVIVDYLQLIPSADGRRSQREIVAEAVTTIGALAAEGLAVVICSQLNRDSERENRPPRMADLRDAGEIEQVGKLILALHVDPKKPDEVELHVLKNHQGPLSQFRVAFDRAHCSMR